MEAKRQKLESKSILKKSGKYLYNQDGTPVLVNGLYLYLNEDGTTSLQSNHPDFNGIENEPEAAGGDGEEAASFEEEEAEPASAVDDSQGWDVTATRLLLSLYKVLRELVNQRKIPTLKRMWVTMAGRLHEHGYAFTPFQVENRYKTLQRSYRRKVEASVKRGLRLHKDLPYERELKELYDKEKKNPDALVNAGGEQISIADFLEATGLSGQRQAQLGAGTSRSRQVLTLTPEMAAKIHFKRPVAVAAKPPAPPPAPAYYTDHARRPDVMEELRDLRCNTLEKLRTMEDKRDAFNEKVLQELRYRNDLLEKLLEHVP